MLHHSFDLFLIDMCVKLRHEHKRNQITSIKHASAYWNELVVWHHWLIEQEPKTSRYY